MMIKDIILGFEGRSNYELRHISSQEVKKVWSYKNEAILFWDNTEVLDTSEEYELVEAFVVHPTAEELRNLNAVRYAMAFGNELIARYGLKNITRDYTTGEIKRLTKDLKDIARLLRVGALESALEEIQEFAPTNEITQEDMDEFSAEIEGYLGL